MGSYPCPQLFVWKEVDYVVRFDCNVNLIHKLMRLNRILTCVHMYVLCALPQLFVWKEVDYGGMSEREKQLLVQEVNLLRELRHPHIVRYHDRIIDRVHSTLYIVMEYCEVGQKLCTKTCICTCTYQYIASAVHHVPRS